MIHQVQALRLIIRGAVLPLASEVLLSAPRSRSILPEGRQTEACRSHFLKGEYFKIADALGGIAHHLTDQHELQRLGQLFYTARRRRRRPSKVMNIYYLNKDLAHMVLSVKPFGCMPSTS